MDLSVASLVDMVRRDIAKVFRFAAVSAFAVPAGLVLLWLFLQTRLAPVWANVLATSLMTIPNYLLNRYWVWQKRGANSVRREIAPFWAMAFLGLALSSLFVWVASWFSDADLLFLALNFLAFGIVWVFKFFVIERFLFGEHTHATAEASL